MTIPEAGTMGMRPSRAVAGVTGGIRKLCNLENAYSDVQFLVVIATVLREESNGGHSLIPCLFGHCLQVWVLLLVLT